MMNNNDNTSFLEGLISVEAAINAKKREVYNVYIDIQKKEKRDRKVIRLISLLKKEAIPFTLCARCEIDAMCEGTSHGGIVAKVGEKRLEELSSLMQSLKSGEYAVMLDGVEDPFNFGYSLRNLFAFGCRAFIMPERNWMSAANIVSTSSAGASELCDMAISKSDEELVRLIKESNADIVCAALSPSSIPLFEFVPNKPFVLFIGGEKRGISKVFMENADRVVHIPYSNENVKYSLPTASCAAIFGSYLSSKQ